MRTRKRQCVGLCVTVLMGACASVPENHVPDPMDPFERYNRAVFSLNDTIDTALLKPVARAYRFVTPDLVQRGIENLFSNVSDVPTAVNDLLQGKGRLAATHLARFALNSTFGLGGVLDVATGAGLERQREDFGQTLGHWGLSSGPYVVLPLFGPSSVRDAFGLVADIGLDPLVHARDDDWRIGVLGLRAIEQRASVLDIEKTIKLIELDPYLFTRDAYLARRLNNVYDGNPPVRPRDGAPASSPPSAPDPADEVPRVAQ